MAINGVITNKVVADKELYVDFKWERKSFSRSNNTSTIEWSITYRDEAIWAGFTAGTTVISLDIDGVVTTESLVANKTSALGKESQVVATGTRTIPHNADGTKDFSVNFTLSFSYGESFPFSGTFTLDRITNASGVSCTTVNIGVAPVITISSQDSSYKHTLSYGFGDDEHGYITGVIVENTSATQISDFIWPTSFYQVIPDSRSGNGIIICDTYNSSGARVGMSTRCNFTANVNEGSSTPVFDSGYPVIEDTNYITKALTGDKNVLVRYASTAYVEIGAKGRNYATIARQKVKNDTAYHEEYTDDLVSISFGNVTSGLFSFELEDSRGFISKPGRDLSATGRFVEYFLPTCNIGNDKPDTHGNLTIKCSGSWFGGSFGAVNNSITAQYRYRLEHDEWENTESEWHSMTVTTNGNSYSATTSFTIPNFDYLAGYVYEARVTDELFTSHSTEYEVKSSALFSWSNEDFEFNVPVKFNAGTTGGTGTGTTDLSKYALKTEIPKTLPSPYALTVNGQTYDGSKAVTINVEGGGTNLSNGGTINGDLTITGDLRLKGDGNYGNTLYFGDGSYANMSEPSDDTLTIKATTINLNGNVNVNGVDISTLTSGSGGAINGTWTPTLSSSAVSSYTVRQGWYQQVGNVVTLGFQIKANCNSGYHTSAISITGVPLTPQYDASGGGVCSGAYISAGCNFECWVVSTSNKISARVQDCNNTTAGNLTTSASGLFYRSGGGEITLGGTICYITN